MRSTWKNPGNCGATEYGGGSTDGEREMAKKRYMCDRMDKGCCG